MISDVLVCFVVFQSVFFLLDSYIYSRMNRNIARKGENQSFCALVIVHLFYLVFNSLWSMQEYGFLHLARPWMQLLCTCSLLSVTLSAFCFFRYTVEKIRFRPLGKRRGFVLSALPELLSATLIVSSPFTGWIFTLSQENLIVHGPLYPVMLVSSSLYLIFVALIAIRNLIRARTEFHRQSAGALLLSVLLILLFVAVDSMLPQASILPAAVFAVIVVIFINMQESNINSDALTGMNNRRKADEFLAERLAEVSGDNPLYLFMGDLNGFKGINDAYGHMEGDAALILCATALKRTIGRFGGFAARFGGDEFLLSIQPGKGRAFDPDAVADTVNGELRDLARAAAKPYQLSMSLGYARCADRGEPFSACIHRADEMLYERKRAFHGRK